MLQVYMYSMALHVHWTVNNVFHFSSAKWKIKYPTLKKKMKMLNTPPPTITVLYLHVGITLLNVVIYQEYYWEVSLKNTEVVNIQLS